VLLITTEVRSEGEGELNILCKMNKGWLEKEGLRLRKRVSESVKMLVFAVVNS